MRAYFSLIILARCFNTTLAFIVCFVVLLASLEEHAFAKQKNSVISKSLNELKNDIKAKNSKISSKNKNSKISSAKSSKENKLTKASKPYSNINKTNLSKNKATRVYNHNNKLNTNQKSIFKPNEFTKNKLNKNSFKKFNTNTLKKQNNRKNKNSFVSVEELNKKIEAKNKKIDFDKPFDIIPKKKSMNKDLEREKLQGALPGSQNTLSKMDEEALHEVQLGHKVDSNKRLRLTLNQQDTTDPLFRPLKQKQKIASGGLYMDVDVNDDTKMYVGAENKITGDKDDSSLLLGDDSGAVIGLEWNF